MERFKVKSSNVRLDKFLAEQLPQISRGEIQRTIEHGLVMVNEVTIVKQSAKIKEGDEVGYQKLENNKERAENKSRVAALPIKFLYEKDGLLIIDKASGIQVHPSVGNKVSSISEELLRLYPDIERVGETHRPGIVHRLDKDTSGCLLVALTPKMYGYLKEAFAERKIKKEYVAMVWGKVEKRHGIIDTLIGKSKIDFRKQTIKNPTEGKTAVTEYWVQEEFDDTTLIKVLLHTGKTHQIRVHLASIGHPLCGDTLYGPKKQLPGLHRQFLHARRIEVRLPDDTWIEAESEIPKDLQSVLKNLGFKI